MKDKEPSASSQYIQQQVDAASSRFRKILKMKEKDTEGFIEKERKHRDRTKKRRLTAEETVEAPKPRMEPYKREKNWVNQQDEE